MLIFYQLRYDKKVDPSNILIAMSLVTFFCISTLSRSTIIFYPLAIIVAYLFNRTHFQRISHLKKIKVIVIFFAIYMLSFSAVSLLRDYYYISADNVPANPVAIMKEDGVIKQGNKVLIAFKKI